MICEYLKVSGTDGSVLAFSKISEVDFEMTTYSRSVRNGKTIIARKRADDQILEQLHFRQF